MANSSNERRPAKAGRKGAVKDCDRYEDSDRWVLICGDECHCTSTLCGNCDQPLQFHRWPVKEAWFNAADETCGAASVIITETQALA